MDNKIEQLKSLEKSIISGRFGFSELNHIRSMYGLDEINELEMINERGGSLLLQDLMGLCLTTSAIISEINSGERNGR